MGIKARLICLILALPLFFAAMILVHEAGHAYAITQTGAASARVYVWPGYQLYPEFGAKYSGAWPGSSLAVTQAGPILAESTLIESLPPSNRTLHFDQEKLRASENVVLLMGVAATTAVSLLSLICLSLLRPKGVLLWILGAGSLMHLDGLAYAIFPVYFDAPHFLFWGGTTSEPITALTRMGIAQELAVAVTAALSALQFAWLYYLPGKLQRTPTSPA